jgi:hypothetical protein
MSAFAEDSERRLVPRWRFTRDVPSSAEFAGDPNQTSCFDPDPRFLEERVAEWRETGAISAAADAVACGVTTGKASLVAEPALFILDRQDSVMPHVYQLAQYALGYRADECCQDIERRLPFLPTTNLARAGVRIARARLRRDPRNVLAYLDLSRAYAVLGKSSQSLHAMQKALQLAPCHRHVL